LTYKRARDKLKQSKATVQICSLAQDKNRLIYTNTDYTQTEAPEEFDAGVVKP